MSDIPKVERGVRIRDESFTHQQVYGVFESLIKNPGRGQLDSRGKSYYHPGEKVRFDNAQDDLIVAENYKRRTSFTEEQEKYMDKCRVLLRDTLTSPEDGVLGRFKKRWDGRGSTDKFEDMLTDAYLESIKVAFNKNPNLTPAFYGFLVSTGAGAEGLELALHEGLYPRGVRSDSLPENYKAFVGKHVAEHKQGKQEEIDSEIQCAAPALAMKIIGEVQKCVYYAGLKVDDIKNTRFGGPTVGLSRKIEGMLAENMNLLGYKVEIRPETD